MMITKVNSNFYNYKSQMPNFKGYNDKTYDVKSQNKQDWCLHETAFFRDIDTMEFAQKYIVQNFPQGTHIADFGCSSGEEAYTLLMLLNKYNKDKKYKVTGYDVSPKVVEVANSGAFRMMYRFTEGFVNLKPEYKDYDKKYLKKLFFKCFERVPERIVSHNPTPEIKEHLQKRIQQEKNLKKLLELKCYNEIFRRHGIHSEFEEGNAFKPKIEFTTDVFEAKLGDINDLSKIIKPDGKAGAIIFKNAWFHILNTFDSFENINIEGAEKIVQSAHNVLPQKGLLVIGTLWKDHIYSNQIPHFISQDGKKIQVVDNTIFHDLLRKNGFEPIFYERIKDVLLGKLDNNKVHLPSVWRKI